MCCLLYTPVWDSVRWQFNVLLGDSCRLCSCLGQCVGWQLNVLLGDSCWLCSCLGQCVGWQLYVLPGGQLLALLLFILGHSNVPPRQPACQIFPSGIFGCQRPRQSPQFQSRVRVHSFSPGLQRIEANYWLHCSLFYRSDMKLWPPLRHLAHPSMSQCSQSYKTCVF